MQDSYVGDQTVDMSVIWDAIALTPMNYIVQYIEYQIKSNYRYTLH